MPYPLDEPPPQGPYRIRTCVSGYLKRAVSGIRTHDVNFIWPAWKAGAIDQLGDYRMVWVLPCITDLKRPSPLMADPHKNFGAPPCIRDLKRIPPWYPTPDNPVIHVRVVWIAAIAPCGNRVKSVNLSFEPSVGFEPTASSIPRMCSNQLS